MEHILKKLHAVMKDVTYVQKTGYNKFHGYKYVTEADVKDAVHKAFVEHGLVPHFSFTEIGDPLPWRPTNQGKEQFLTRVKIDYCFFDPDSGESVSGSSIGTGIDGEDKGLYKAIAGGIKYVLTSIFLIPTGDDPERDSEADEATQPQKKQNGFNPNSMPQPGQKQFPKFPVTPDGARSAFRTLVKRLDVPPNALVKDYMRRLSTDNLTTITDQDPMAIIALVKSDWAIEPGKLRETIIHHEKEMAQAQKLMDETFGDDPPPEELDQEEHPQEEQAAPAKTNGNGNGYSTMPFPNLLGTLVTLTGKESPALTAKAFAAIKKNFGDPANLGENQEAREWIISLITMSPEDRNQLLTEGEK